MILSGVHLNCCASRMERTKKACHFIMTITTIYYMEYFHAPKRIIALYFVVSLGKTAFDQAVIVFQSRKSPSGTLTKYFTAIRAKNPSLE
jgi:hypothetical protein